MKSINTCENCGKALEIIKLGSHSAKEACPTLTCGQSREISDDKATELVA